jgi:hypothetical protein
MSKEGAVFFPFNFSHCIFDLFSYFISYHLIFIPYLTAINLLMFVLVRKRLLLVFDRCFDVQVRGTP